MRKITTRLGAAVVAFIVGTIAASYLAINRSHHADEAAVPYRVVATEAMKPDIHLEWRKITIGKASFYVPSQLKHTGPPGNEGIIEALRGEVSKDNELYLYYAYGRRVPSDANPHIDQGTKVIVNGRAGRLWVWQPDRSGSPLTRLESPTMELSVPDIGDGKTKFELYVAGWDLSILRQVIDSVEVR